MFSNCCSDLEMVDMERNTERWSTIAPFVAMLRMFYNNLNY